MVRHLSPRPFVLLSDASKYKGTAWIIHDLVDTTAKGGNFMLGVGPSGHGSFHPTAIEQLKGAGKWLQVNGEGIYATRPRSGTDWEEGPNLRFSRSKENNTIYCFALAWPGKTLTIKSIDARQAGNVQLLGYPKKLAKQWDSAQGLTIILPKDLQQESNRPCEFAWCFKISNTSTR